MFKAVLFDMDGVLVDSEIYWKDVEKKFFESNGIKFTKKLHAQIMGTSETDVILWSKKVFNIKKSFKTIKKERDKLSEKIYTDYCRPLPYVNKFIKKLQKKGIKIAIVSSSSFYRIKTVLDKFKWNSFFSNIISAEKIRNSDFKGKPAPDIYLYTSKVLKIKPADCIVFEDSKNGINSAKSAGMKCIQIADPRWNKNKFREADLTVESFNDKRIEDFVFNK